MNIIKTFMVMGFFTSVIFSNPTKVDLLNKTESEKFKKEQALTSNNIKEIFGKNTEQELHYIFIPRRFNIIDDKEFHREQCFYEVEEIILKNPLNFTSSIKNELGLPDSTKHEKEFEKVTVGFAQWRIYLEYFPSKNIHGARIKITEPNKKTLYVGFTVDQAEQLHAIVERAEKAAQ